MDKWECFLENKRSGPVLFSFISFQMASL